MCFHFSISKPIKKIEQHFGASFQSNHGFDPTNHLNGFEFPKAPIITNKNRQAIQLFNWGLIPDWASDTWNKSYTLNARLETLTEKPAFKDCIENRCIILTDGFYEWQHIGKQKIKYNIGFDHQLFAFAGLYTASAQQSTFTIITTKAEGVMKTIHNTKLRMPVALKSLQAIDLWLLNNELKHSFDFTATRLDAIQTQLF
jgi:putative SOS response-associated peptidase YedK